MHYFFYRTKAIDLFNKIQVPILTSLEREHYHEVRILTSREMEHYHEVFILTSREMDVLEARNTNHSFYLSDFAKIYFKDLKLDIYSKS